MGMIWVEYQEFDAVQHRHSAGFGEVQGEAQETIPSRHHQPAADTAGSHDDRSRREAGPVHRHAQCWYRQSAAATFRGGLRDTVLLTGRDRSNSLP
jgi:hypothetical protein